MVKYKFILNKFTISKKNFKKWAYAKSILENKLDFSCIFVNNAKEAVNESKKAAKNYDVIVACGGDGLIRDVLNGIIGSKVCLGILPLGTSNDFAKSKKIKDIDIAIKVLVNNKKEYIDIGKVKLNNKIYYYNSTSGIGFDASMLKLNTNKGFTKIKRIFGHLSYILAALLLSLNYKAARTDIRFNGKLHNVRLFELNANFVKSMSGMKVTPNADGKNGFFDIFLFRKVFWPKMVIGFIWYYITSKKIPFREAEYITDNPMLNSFNLEKITKFSIYGSLPVQLNGDYIGTGKVEFEIMPKAVRLLVPRL